MKPIKSSIIFPSIFSNLVARLLDDWLDLQKDSKYSLEDKYLKGIEKVFSLANTLRLLFKFKPDLNNLKILIRKVLYCRFVPIIAAAQHCTYSFTLKLIVLDRIVATFCSCNGLIFQSSMCV